MKNEINRASRFGSQSATFPIHLIAYRARLWATHISLSALACVAQSTRAAVTEAWVHRYNGPANGYDYAYAVAVDVSGNVIVTGSSENGTNYDVEGYTAKYAAGDSALLWEKR